jgi:hypothetical protein
MHLFYVTLVDLKYFVYIDGASPVERWGSFSGAGCSVGDHGDRTARYPPITRRTSLDLASFLII